ncbi:MAG: BatD family protein [Verrucomicrobia bacterium]|nr:BatD family protein [Verrucomicrobiota bacterium]
MQNEECKMPGRRTRAIFIFHFSFFIFHCAGAQLSNAPDPLITLMQSQPPIITAAPTQVVARFDPPLVRVGEEATYRVALDALLDSIDWPDKTPASGGLQLHPSARGQTFRVFGQTLRPFSAFNFRARSEQPGTFTIPAFTVQAYGRPVRIPAAQLQVVATNTIGSMTSPRLALQILATNIFVGQSVKVRVTVAGMPPGVVQGLSQMEIREDGVMMDRSLTRQRIETRTVNGTNIATLIYETEIIPITVGELPLAAQGFLSDNLFGGSITITGSVTVATLPPTLTLVDSDPVTVRVRPLPRKGELPGFNGAIGSFAIDPPTLASNAVRAGDPVKLIVTIRGQGNLTRLLPPTPPQSGGWQLFAASSDNAIPQLIQARGFATFIFTLIPTSVDVRGTPPMPFSYFDPDRAVYADLTIPSVPLTAKPSQQPTDTQAVAQAEAPPARREKELRLSELATKPGATTVSLVPLPLRKWFPFLQIAPVLGFLALWGWDRRRRFLERHPDIVVRRRARRELRRARRQLRNAISQSDAAGIASCGVKAMRVAVAPHFPAEPRALVGADVLSLLSEKDQKGRAGATVRELFDKADAARFSTKPAASSDLLAGQTEIERVLDQLEEKL